MPQLRPRHMDNAPPARKKTHPPTFDERVEQALCRAIDSRYAGIIQDLTDSVAERLHPEKDKA
jgi:hypothetical protein